MEFIRNSLLHKTDSYTYEYLIQDDVCRFCWQRNTFQEFASKDVVLNGVKVEVLRVIQECLDVELRGINYPNKVCDQCWEIVKKFYIFKTLCKEADFKLKEIINTGPTRVTNQNDIKREIKQEIEIDSNETEVTHRSQTNYKVKKRPNYCYICSSEFDDRKKFTEHNSQCHGIENGLYKCFGCDKKCKNMRTRTSHETNYCKALKQGYKCSLCGRLLPQRKSYEAHMRYHAGKETDVVLELSENIFKCKNCDASFKTKDKLKEHMGTHNSTDKQFVCETCGRVFLRQDYLRKHLLMHQGVKRHVCTHCDLRFVQKSSLNVHLRKHTGERPFSCDVCPQRCVSSSNLRAHRLRHLGVKPFECAICGKKFGYKMSLAEHIAAHAPMQSHRCALCGAQYKRRRGLQRHMARVHPPKHPGGAPSQVDRADSAQESVEVGVPVVSNPM